jgi:hypothetical protein
VVSDSAVPDIFRLRKAMQTEVENLYIEGLQLKRIFEIFTEALKKIKLFLELNSTSAKSKKIIRNFSS